VPVFTGKLPLVPSEPVQFGTGKLNCQLYRLHTVDTLYVIVHLFTRHNDPNMTDRLGCMCSQRANFDVDMLPLFTLNKRKLPSNQEWRQARLRCKHSNIRSPLPQTLRNWRDI